MPSKAGAGSSSLGRIGSQAWVGIHQRETHQSARTSWSPRPSRWTPPPRPPCPLPRGFCPGSRPRRCPVRRRPTP
eukprot:668494-Prorocentrum_minimum.AAC.1